MIADLVARAVAPGRSAPEQLEQQRLLLERARLERAIRRAREQRDSGIGELAREQRERARRDPAIDTRIEQAV